MQNQSIDYLSGIPLHIEVYFNDTYLASGTGFVIEKNSNNHLITNWHVLSGRDPLTQKCLSRDVAIPNNIRVWMHTKGKLGSWVKVMFNLYDENYRQKWKEKKLQDGTILDVVSLEVHLSKDVQVYPLNLSLMNTDLLMSPSETVSIIGFPYGLAAAGKFPIWKTGHIASDIDLNYSNKPLFIIDATTKPGMSGSPVIARRSGARMTSSGTSIMNGFSDKFMGIYSGRIQDGDIIDMSNLGMVWKPSVIDMLFE